MCLNVYFRCPGGSLRKWHLNASTKTKQPQLSVETGKSVRQEDKQSPRGGWRSIVFQETKVSKAEGGKMWPSVSVPSWAGWVDLDVTVEVNVWSKLVVLEFGILNVCLCICFSEMLVIRNDWKLQLYLMWDVSYHFRNVRKELRPSNT